MAASYSLSSDVFVNISDLQPGSSSDGVKVRVIRCYRQPSPYKTDSDGSLELILHDEIEDRIHATMDYGVFKDKKIDIVEGGLYRIRNFMVTHDMSKYKTTTNRYKLRLLIKTSIIPFKDNGFPSSMHKFRDLFEIANDISVDNFQLLDVIGRVVSYQKPTFVAKVETRRMDFKIANIEGKELGCSLWSNYIDPVLAIFEKKDNRPIIICIQFGKITRIYDEIKVSNTFHVTKVTVNGDSDVFKNFLDGMMADVSGSQENGIAEEVTDVYGLFKENAAQMSQISELAVLQEKKTYWVDATIAEIERKGGFYYASCRTCFKKMPMDEKNRKCFICGEDNFTENFRYKIEVLVADASGCANMLMWDAQCTQLIGKPVKYMKDLNDKAGTKIPRELHESLVDKRVLFEVKTPSNKVNSGIPQFIVQRVANDEDIFDIYAKNYTPTRGSTTDCNVRVNENDDEACSKLRKGKEKMDVENLLENDSDVEVGLKLRDETEDDDSGENIQDENDNCGDDVTLKKLKNKRNAGYDAKCSSKSKKLKIQMGK